MVQETKLEVDDEDPNDVWPHASMLGEGKV